MTPKVAAASKRAKPGRPSGRRPGQSTEQTKQALLRSARQVFADNGYERATIAEIVRRAGVTSPVLYHHFGNKAGLFRAAIIEVADLLRGAWDRALRDKVTLRERLDAMLVAAIDIHALDPQLAPFLIAARIEAVRHPELRSVHEYRQSEISIFEKSSRTPESRAIAQR
ncbi:MAG: helix-turn-helix domain containing protein [Actinomycetota bacterium]|nr:helix-turn-helix domain containing protein [Actinomycetota bacterium]